MMRSISISSLAARGLLLVILAIAWTIGILLEDTSPISPQSCLLLSCCFFLLLIIFWQEQRNRLYLLLFLFISLGAWHCAQVQPQYDSLSLQPLLKISPPPVLRIRGTVTDEPKLQTRTRLLTISVNSIQTKGSSQWIPFDGTIQAITLFQDSSPEDPYGANYGDSVELTGKLLPPTPTSPKNVIASMAFPRIFVSATEGNAIIASIYHLRNQMARLIEQALPQPEAALLIAIFLGLRTPALQPLRQAFNVTGTAHLIVPSGFKVTILSGLVSSSTGHVLPAEDTGSFPLTPLHKSWRDWIKMVLILLCIAFYTVLSGAGPAALRAGIMGGLLVIAPRLGRQYNVYTGLAGATFIMTCIDPFLLWDVGFQLSFLGTLGIVILTPYFQKLLQPIAKLPAGTLMVELAAVTMAAQIATLPIFAVAFQQVSLIAPIANILTVPLLGPLIILGLGISIAGFIFHPLSLLCGWIAWPFLWYVQAAINQCSTRIFAFFTIDHLPEPLAWLYYALLTPVIIFLLYHYPLSSISTKKHPPLLTPYNSRLLQIGGVVLIIVITGITIISAPSPTSNTVSFFNIDSATDNGPNIDMTKANKKHIYGEAIFIRTRDGKTLLIDGGGDSVSLSQLLDSHLPSWQRSLDMVILTSPQQDTITGLQDVLTRYQVGFVFDAGMAHPTTTYARWRRIINERNLQYKAVAQDTTISLGTTMQIQVLWPQHSLHTAGSNEVRDNGLILRLVMPGLRLLLLGSSIQSSYALTNLLSSVDGNMLKSDVVQVLGEMDTSVPAAFTDVLKQAQPSLVIITSSTPRKTSKSASSNAHVTLSTALASIPQTLQTAQSGTGTLELQSDNRGWTMSE